MPNLPELKDYVKYYNSYRVQSLDSEACGLFCVYVLDELNKGRDYIDVLTDFHPSDYMANEKFIKRIFQTFYIIIV